MKNIVQIILCIALFFSLTVVNAQVDYKYNFKSVELQKDSLPLNGIHGDVNIADVQSFDFKVLPTLNNKEINVIINKDVSPAELSVLNLTGQKIFSLTIYSHTKLNKIINLASEQNGIYIVMLCNDSFCKTYKIAI